MKTTSARASWGFLLMPVRLFSAVYGQSLAAATGDPNRPGSKRAPPPKHAPGDPQTGSVVFQIAAALCRTATQAAGDEASPLSVRFEQTNREEIDRRREYHAKVAPTKRSKNHSSNHFVHRHESSAMLTKRSTSVTSTVNPIRVGGRLARTRIWF